MTPPRITFLGAADTVTGSRYLVEHDGVRVLVDCGLLQRPKSSDCATGSSLGSIL